MPGGWNGSGVFTRYYGTNTWQNDAANGTLIVADRHDNNDGGLADGINACLTKNGENTFTGTTGASAFRGAVDNTSDLGSTSLRWRNLYAGTSVIFQGASFATTVTAAPTANRAIVVPNLSGTLAVTSTAVATNIALSGSSTVNLVATGLDPNLARLIVSFNNVSLSGTDDMLIQLGTGGSFAAVGTYSSASSRTLNAAASVRVSSTSGFIISAGAAASILHGCLILTRFPASAGGDRWCCTGVLFGDGLGGSNATVQCGGDFDFTTVAAAIDGIRVSTTGANTFDAGTMSVMGSYA